MVQAVQLAYLLRSGPLEQLAPWGLQAPEPLVLDQWRQGPMEQSLAQVLSLVLPVLLACHQEPEREQVL